MWNGVEYSWIIYTHLILIIFFFSNFSRNIQVRTQCLKVSFFILQRVSKHILVQFILFTSGYSKTLPLYDPSLIWAIHVMTPQNILVIYKLGMIVDDMSTYINTRSTNIETRSNKTLYIKKWLYKSNKKNLIYNKQKYIKKFFPWQKWAFAHRSLFQLIRLLFYRSL